ncbi:MAG TPA: CRTAC1 family protein [Thermoanaerobaculia bacterium]|nr:CRTAC1 family protein [Thermoanaerobaculia bacterium]
MENGTGSIVLREGVGPATETGAVEPERAATAVPRRTRRGLKIAAAGLALVAAGLWLTVRSVDSSAQRFLDSGKGAVVCLDGLAKALKARDAAGIAARISESFAGSSLGLGAFGPANVKDGVHIAPFVARGALPDRAAFVAAWRRYLASFQSIDEVALHVHLLEEWSGGDVVATVRYELIGTPRGAPFSGIDRAIFRMRFERAASGFRIREASLVSGDRTIGDRPQFTNVAHAAGVDFTNRYYPPFLELPLRFAMLRYGPAGITAVDFDDDGWYDLFVPDGVSSRLFRNRRDGTFEDVTAASGLAGLDGVSVGVFADYDNDGHKDFFVSRTFQPNQLFHNDGNGHFTDVTKRSGIGADCCTTVAAWGDYDNDGYLDLYVGRYLDPRREIPTTFYARNGERDQLYHNNGDGTFSNVTEASGAGDVGLCLGAVWGDYDDDGDLDLYVVNDFGRNTLYRNEGGGKFRDVTVAANALAYGAGMSASFGDYDNDGKLDIYVANIRSEYRWFGEQPIVRLYMLNSLRQGVWRSDWPLYLEIFRQSGFKFKEVFQQMGSGNTLLHNKGDGTFEDVTWAAGANPPGWFWGSGFADFDNDGWQDVYSANGWVYNAKDTEIELDFFEGVAYDQKKYKTGYFFNPNTFGNRSWHGWEHNRHLRNNGDGTFSEIGRAAGDDLVLNSRGIAVADFWNRGVLDLAVAASTDRHALLRNEVGLARPWLAIEVRGAGRARPDGSNRDGVGARIEVRTGERRQIREIALGDGYGSQNSLRQYFGLGTAESVDELTVTWPRSHARQTFKNLAARRIYRLDEGAAALAEVTPERPPA